MYLMLLAERCGIMQLAGRTPAMCAMQAQTVDVQVPSQRWVPRGYREWSRR
jgi:hypothetical protein